MLRGGRDVLRGGRGGSTCVTTVCPIEGNTPGHLEPGVK